MSVSQHLIMRSSVQVHIVTLLLKHFTTTITLPLNRYFNSIKKNCNNSVPLTRHQNMDKEIKKNCFGPLKKREGKAKKKHDLLSGLLWKSYHNILGGIRQLY
jgi:hypothetical protein